MLDQGGEQQSRARDLVAVTARLLGDRADLLLRFLGTSVQGRSHTRRRVRFLPPLADQRALPLRALGKVPGGGRDLLSGGLQRGRGGAELVGCPREPGDLPLRVTDGARDGVRRAVDARPQVAKLVALRVRHAGGEVAALELGEHFACGA